MVVFICLFLPALVASFWMFKIKSEKVVSWTFLYYYSLFLVLIFILNQLVLKYFFNYTLAYLNDAMFNVSFSLRYLLLSMVWACVLPLVIGTLEKNIDLKIVFKRKGADFCEEEK